MPRLPHSHAAATDLCPPPAKPSSLARPTPTHCTRPRAPELFSTSQSRRAPRRGSSTSRSKKLASLLDWRRLDDFENRGVQRADSVLALDKTVNVAKELSILAARDPEFAAVLERAMIHASRVLVESITADAVTRVGSAGAQDVIPVELLEAPQHTEAWRSVRVGGDAKTPKSRRTLALSELVVGVLRRHQQEQTTAAGEAGEHWKDHGLVFPSEIGTPQDRYSVLRMFRSALALVPGLDPQEGTPRDLRHSFVSILSQRGVPIEKISCLMGHFGIRFHRGRLPPRAQTCHPVSSERHGRRLPVRPDSRRRRRTTDPQRCPVSHRIRNDRQTPLLERKEDDLVRTHRTRSSDVEPGGLEPPTPCLQSRCATNCAMAPGDAAGAGQRREVLTRRCR